MKYSFVCMLLCIGISRSLTSAMVLPQVNDDHHWNYLILSQFWPESSCIYLKEHDHQRVVDRTFSCVYEKAECDIPPKIKGWTVHGLWPSRPDSTVFPHNCNDSMVFNITQLQVLRPELDLEWHFYKKGADPTYLWNHEWTKHGTCAFSLPDLRGELKYFNKTLELHSHLNLTEALAKSDVVPSHTDTYKRDVIFNAVLKYYNFKPFVVCEWDNEEKKAYLDQIYLCYDKTFHLQDCYPTPSRTETDASGSKIYYPSSYFENCMERDNIYYIPYNENNQKTSHKDTDKSLVFQSEIGNSLIKSGQ